MNTVELLQRAEKLARDHSGATRFATTDFAGAKEPDVCALEEVLGIQLPSSLRQLFMARNGTTWATEVAQPVTPSVFVGGCRLMSLQEIAAYWQQLRTLDTNFPSVPRVPRDGANSKIRSYRLHRKGWVPLAVSSTRDAIFVDLDPGPAGTKGQLIRYDLELAPRWLASSLNAYLEDFICCVERNLIRAIQGNWVSTSDGKVISSLSNLLPRKDDSTASLVQLPKAALPLKDQSMGQLLKRVYDASWKYSDGTRFPESARPPVRTSALTRFQATLGVTLPVEVVEYYRCENGRGRQDFSEDYKALTFPHNSTPLPIKDVIANWQALIKLPERAPTSWFADAGKYMNTDKRFRPGWIPFALPPRHLAAALFGAELDKPLVCIDLDPGPLGTVGQLILVDPSGPLVVLGTGLKQYLADLVRCAERGLIRGVRGVWVRTSDAHAVLRFSELLAEEGTDAR